MRSNCIPTRRSVLTAATAIAVAAPVAAEAAPAPSPQSYAEFSIRDLVSLYAAYRTTADALLSVMNQPRCKEGAASDQLEEEWQTYLGKCEDIGKEVARRNPSDGWERWERAGLLTEHAVFCGMDDRTMIFAEAVAAALVKGEA